VSVEYVVPDVAQVAHAGDGAPVGVRVVGGLVSPTFVGVGVGARVGASVCPTNRSLFGHADVSPLSTPGVAVAIMDALI